MVIGQKRQSNLCMIDSKNADLNVFLFINKYFKATGILEKLKKFADLQMNIANLGKRRKNSFYINDLLLYV